MDRSSKLCCMTPIKNGLGQEKGLEPPHVFMFESPLKYVYVWNFKGSISKFNKLKIDSE